jgi:hypothetical protein
LFPIGLFAFHPGLPGFTPPLPGKLA